MFHRKATTDIERIERRALFAQLAIDSQAFLQLVPIVEAVLNSVVNKEVKHLQLEEFLFLDDVAVVVHDLAMADSQTGGVIVGLRFFARGDTDSDVAFLLHQRDEVVQFVHVVQHRQTIEPIIDQLRDQLHIQFALVTVVNDVGVLRDLAILKQVPNDVNVERG